jgi:hypothetical protein
MKMRLDREIAPISHPQQLTISPRCEEISENGMTVYTSEDKIYIDAYHPAQRHITRDIYVNGIIRAVEIWVKVKNIAI